MVRRIMSGRGQSSTTYVMLIWGGTSLAKDGDEILQDTAVNNMDVLGSF